MAMKLHDYHVILQQILLVCLWHRMDKVPQDVVMWICKVFKLICNKVYDLALHEVLKIRVVIMLCLLEMVFPPSFFDLMTHLVVHLIDKLDLCGLVHSHWVYPIERVMKDLKGYVRNMCKLEGCMTKGYIFDEALGLCIEYM